MKRWFVYLTPIAVVLIATRKFIWQSGLLLFGEFSASERIGFTWHTILNSWSSYLGFGHSTIGWPEVLGGGTAFGTIPQSTQVVWLAYRTLLDTIFGSFGDSVYLFIGMIFPFYTMYLCASYVLRHYSRARLGAYIAAFFYLVNTQYALRTTVGTIRFHYAHALFPLAYYLFHKGLNEPQHRWHYFIGFSLVCGILAVIVPHYLVLLAPILLLESIGHWFSDRPTERPKLMGARLLFLISGLAVGTLLIGSALIAARYLSPAAITPAGQFFSLSALSLGGLNPDTLLTMLRLGTPSLAPGSLQPLLPLLLPLLALAAFAVAPRRLTGFYLLLALVAYLLATGVQPPLAGLKTWFFLNLPGMSAFRDPSKILAVAIFAQSLLFGFLVVKLAVNKTATYVTAGGLLLLIVLVNPVYLSGDFNRTLFKVRLPANYHQLNLTGRVAALPAPGYIYSAPWYTELGQTSSTQESVWASIAPSDNLELVSVATPNNNFSERFVQYWLNGKRDPLTFAYLAKKAATNSFVSEPGAEAPGTIAEKGNYLTVSNLEPGQTYPTALIAPTVIVASGDLNIFGELAAQQVPADMPVIFVNQLPSIEAFSKLVNQNNPVVVADAAINNLKADLIFKHYLVPTAKLTWYNLRPNGQWLFADSLAGDYAKQGVEFISANSMIGDKSAQQAIPLPAGTSGNYVLLARTINENKVARAVFSTDEQANLGELVLSPTTTTKTIWSALPVSFTGDQLHSITVSLTEGTLLIDGLSLVPKAVWDDLDQQLAAVKIKTVADLQPSDWDTKLPRPVQLTPQPNAHTPTSFDLSEVPQTGEWLLVRYSHEEHWRLGSATPLVADGYAQLFEGQTGVQPTLTLSTARPYRWLLLGNGLLWIILVIAWCVTRPKRD